MSYQSFWDVNVPGGINVPEVIKASGAINVTVVTKASGDINVPRLISVPMCVSVLGDINNSVYNILKILNDEHKNLSETRKPVRSKKMCQRQGNLSEIRKFVKDTAICQKQGNLSKILPFVRHCHLSDTAICQTYYHHLLDIAISTLLKTKSSSYLLMLSNFESYSK